MTPFYFLFGVTLIVSCFSLMRGFQFRVAGAVLFVGVVFLVTLAYATTDSFQYESIYDRVTQLERVGPLGYPVSVTTQIEPGFALFILLEKAFTGSMNQP